MPGAMTMKADGTVNTLGNSLGAGVADSVGRSMAYGESEQAAAMILQSGDASDEAVRGLLPLIQAKMYEHGFDTGHVRELFLKIDNDRSGKISPKEFFERMANWGVNLTSEQCLHLLEPFDVDYNGEIDYTEFCRWVAMWDTKDGDGEDGQWYRGGSLDKRVWAASGSGLGRVGRLHRLMQMIDVDHNGGVESWEFIKALAKGDDYDRPVNDTGMGGGLGGGRLNADGTLKDEYKPGFNKNVVDDGHGAENDDEKIELLMFRLQKKLNEGGPEVNGTFEYMLKRAGGNDGRSTAQKLAEAVSCVDVSTDGLLELVNKFGDVGAGGEKELPIHKLLQMLGDHGQNGCKFGAPPEPKPMVQREQVHPKVIRKKPVERSGGWDRESTCRVPTQAAPPKTDEEAEQEKRLADHLARQAEIQAEKDAEAQLGRDLNAAAQADRLNPQIQNLSATELKRVQMNDNGMVQQLRAELFERSSEMKSMMKRMDSDNSGSISLIEFRKALQRSGFTDSGSMHKKGLDRDSLAVDIKDTVRLFNYFDGDGDGELSYHEFMRLLQDSMKIDYHSMVVGENQDVTLSGGGSTAYT